MTSIAIRRSLHPKYLCETVRYARSVPHGRSCSPARSNRLPDEISVVEPPDPIPNSEVKRNSADGSVGFPCESRSSSGFYPEAPSQTLGASSLGAKKFGRPGAEANMRPLRWDTPAAGFLCLPPEPSQDDAPRTSGQAAHSAAALDR